MRHLKSYNLFEKKISSVAINDIKDIFLDLQDNGFEVDVMEDMQYYKEPDDVRDSISIVIEIGGYNANPEGFNSGVFVPKSISDCLSRLKEYVAEYGYKIVIAIPGEDYTETLEDFLNSSDEYDCVEVVVYQSAKGQLDY